MCGRGSVGKVTQVNRHQPYRQREVYCSHTFHFWVKLDTFVYVTVRVSLGVSCKMRASCQRSSGGAR
jgi:hypothetical protein